MKILMSCADLVGMIGVFLVLVAYYFLNINKMTALSISYLLLNFIGSWLILFSLFFNWNLSSVIIEIAWIMISLIGLYRYLKNRSMSQ